MKLGSVLQIHRLLKATWEMQAPHGAQLQPNGSEATTFKGHLSSVT